MFCSPGNSKCPANAERVKARAVHDPENIRQFEFFRIYYKKYNRLLHSTRLARHAPVAGLPGAGAPYSPEALQAAA
jgi:hypothetical protein